MLADDAMAAKRGVVDQHGTVADLAVMGDMGADHQHAAIADHRDAAAGDGAGIGRRIFADDAVAANLQTGVLAAISDMLRRRAD